jgi:hypothetical protein
MSYAAPILESQPDPFWAFSAIREILEGIDLDAMSKPERNIALIDRMVGQVSNGGFDQYFFNDGFDFPQESLKALAEAGMPRMEAILGQAIAVMGPGPYEPNEERRLELSKLDQEFYKVDQEELYPKAIDYIRNRVSDFGWTQGEDTQT